AIASGDLRACVFGEALHRSNRDQVGIEVETEHGLAVLLLNVGLLDATLPRDVLLEARDTLIPLIINTGEEDGQIKL
ncbi:MAG TPA: hypothetical protein VGE07_03730, partial [Herpetosiphonaceae bacterium]